MEGALTLFSFDGDATFPTKIEILGKINFERKERLERFKVRVYLPSKYLFEVSKNRKRCEICSKLTIKNPEQCQ